MLCEKQCCCVPEKIEKTESESKFLIKSEGKYQENNKIYIYFVICNVWSFDVSEILV